MKNWLGILLSLTLPNFADGQTAKTLQLTEGNVVIRFAEPSIAAAAREVLTAAVGAQQELAEQFQPPFGAPIEIHLSTTTYAFCQATGQPWWQASIYRHRVIYLQPLRVLRERGILITTLRHELVHHLIEEQSRGHSPRWLSEALAVYHSGEIALLKPARRQVRPADLKWLQLEKRLAQLTSRAEAEQLYFQLYYLGQFLETKVTLPKLVQLLQKLAEKTPLTQACRELCGEEATTLEESWLQYAREKLR